MRLATSYQGGGPAIRVHASVVVDKAAWEFGSREMIEAAESIGGRMTGDATMRP